MITHDLGVVAEIADDVVVMYAGKVIEEGSVERSSTRRSIRIPGACSVAAAARHRRRAADADPGPAAVAAQPAERLPLPPALPVRDGPVPSRRARARAARDRRRASAGLLARRRHEGARGGEAARRRLSGGRREHEHDALLVVENLKKYFPVTRGIIFQKEVAAVKAVDDISLQRPARARRSASWASRAAASRRWRAASCGCSTRPAAGSSSTAATSRSCRAPRCGRSGAR